MEHRTRSFRVQIETPADDAGKRVIYHRRTDLYEGDTCMGVANDQPAPISFSFLEEASTIRTVTDPVTGQTISVSIAGIAALISEDYTRRAENGPTP